MIRSSKIFSAVPIGAILSVLTALGDTAMICSECGYENPAMRELCVHCEAKLPDSPDSKPADSKTQSNQREPESDGLEFLSPEIVLNEMDMGLKRLEEQDVELARLFFKNSVALNALADSRGTNDRASRILAYIEQCEASRESVREKCSICRGTGQGTMKIASLSGAVTYRDAPGKPCVECGGEGYVWRRATVDELKYRIGKALSRYTAQQQARRFDPVGGAWVPAGIADKLSLRQETLLRRVAAPSCPACAGVGRNDCGKCNGGGKVKCSNSRCVNGFVTVETGGNLAKAKQTTAEKCAICGGEGTIPCSECGGKGSVLCRKCGGSGERQACRKCGGQGIIECGRCGGSGAAKGAICSSCGGNGIARCSSCAGDGRTR